MIVEIDDGFRFDEKGRTGRGLIMYHTSDLSLIFCLDRNTVAVVTHRNNVVLQVGSVGAVHHAVQLGVNFVSG